MAASLSDSFPDWLASRLRDLRADDEVFSPYILSILEEGGGEDEDVLESLADVLEGLGLDTSLPETHADSPSGFKAQIWSRWQSKSSQDAARDETAAVTASLVSSESAASNIKSQLASITEKATEEYKARASQKPINQSEIDAKKAVKAAIMSQYQNGEVETDGESDDDGGEGGGGADGESELGMMRNTNAEAVAKAEQDKREKGRLAAAAKKEKDKEDREKQKKQAEDKKKKAQEKAAKVERRR